MYWLTENIEESKSNEKNETDQTDQPFKSSLCIQLCLWRRKTSHCYILMPELPGKQGCI